VVLPMPLDSSLSRVGLYKKALMVGDQRIGSLSFANELSPSAYNSPILFSRRARRYAIFSVYILD
jgi:hypothetical protein